MLSTATFTRVARVLSIAVAFIGIVVLMGWVTGVEILITGFPRAIAMIPWTALTMIVAATSLWLQTPQASSDWPTSADRGQRIPLALSSLVSAVGLTMLIQRIANLDWPLNRLLFGDDLARFPWRPIGLMATNSAVCFVLIGVALMTLGQPSKLRTRIRESCGATALLISLLGILGHTYGASPLYSLEPYSGMAPLTVIAFTLLSTAVLAAHPAGGKMQLLTGSGATATFTRRLLAASIALPVTFGFVWLEARRGDFVSRELGVSLFVIAIILVFTFIVVWSATAMRLSETEQEAARENAERASQTAIDAQSAAEMANKSKSEFLAVMSHEFRTPLNAIRGYADLLDMGIAGPVNEEQRSHLKRIQRSEAHLLRLIDDLLNYTQIETGRLTYAFEDIPLRALFEETVVLTQPRADARGINLDVRLREAMDYTVRGDSEKLVQIIVNLVSNAIKFSDAGGTVVIEGRFDHQTDDKKAMIEVRDRGRGIPEHQLSRIFEPFVQVENGLTRRADGVGLGLSISRTLAMGMSCELSVASSPERGTVFTLAVPCSALASHDQKTRPHL